MITDQIAVVILNWNGQKFLEQFLPKVIQYSSIAKVCVADNQSSDDSVAFVKKHFPEVIIIQNTSNNGFAGGYNVALKQINAEYYVLLNSDVEVTEHWLEPTIALMDSNKNIAACQPKILDYNHKHLFEYAGAAGGFIDKYGYPFCRGRVFNDLEEDKNQYNDAVEVFWATGACMFVRAEAFWKVGGFDIDYFAHMEEIDLCWRLKNIGYQIYTEPKSLVYHVGGGTLHKLSPTKTYLNFRNNLTTLTKNSSPRFLFFKILYRMVLDGIAAYKFLFEGKGAHFIAVAKAHVSFYAQLSSTLKKRKAMKALPNFRHTDFGILKKNIVYLHFVKGIKTFNEIINTMT
jgi:GT2 family glycosyltransferase